MSSYDALVAAATAAPFRGWDFSWLAGRIEQRGPSWSYDQLAHDALRQVDRALDLDTGGGEQLASFAPLPAHTVAIESYQPNLAVARRLLDPLGVTVRASTAAGLPAADGEFDLVLSRHGGLPAAELHRVLAPGGRVVSQLVGADNDPELNAALGAPPPDYGVDLPALVDRLRGNGFRIVTARSERPVFAFFDVGAVIYHLRGVSWQIPDFTVQRYDRALRALHDRIDREGAFHTHDHRCLIVAERDRSPIAASPGESR